MKLDPVAKFFGPFWVRKLLSPRPPTQRSTCARGVELGGGEGRAVRVGGEGYRSVVGAQPRHNHPSLCGDTVTRPLMRDCALSYAARSWGRGGRWRARPFSPTPELPWTEF